MDVAEFDKTIKQDEFAELFDAKTETSSNLFIEYWKSTNTRYREARKDEAESHILDALTRAETRRRADAGNNRTAFEEGWAENLSAIESVGLSMDALRPRYFRSSRLLRYKRRLIVAQSDQIEYELFVLARTLIFYKWLQDFQRIIEIGCGSCGNILLLQQMFPEIKTIGLDWTDTSERIADRMKELAGLNVSGGFFDMLHPETEYEFGEEAAILTVHAMEQLGDRFGPFLEFMLNKKPGLIVHYEPIEELYDKTNLYDFLSLHYMRSRGYLSGFLDALRSLEEEGRVEILSANRPTVGGLYHEASVIVWRPI